MKLKTHYSYIVNIFAVYWFSDETYFLGLPKNHGGLIAYKSEEFELIDSIINFKSIYFDNNAKGIYHWALIQEKLLDDLLERDEDAYKRFLEIIKSEGLVDDDFY